jgi:hypothetical protein
VSHAGGFVYPNVATSNLAQVPTGGELFGIQSNSILYRISEAGAYQQIGPLSSTQFWNAHILVGSDGNLWGDFQGGDCNDQGMVSRFSPAPSTLQRCEYGLWLDRAMDIYSVHARSLRTRWGLPQFSVRDADGSEPMLLREVFYR